MKKISLIFFLFFSSIFVFSQNETTILNIKIVGNNKTKKEIILREVTFQKNKNYKQDILKEKIKERRGIVLIKGDLRKGDIRKGDIRENKFDI